MARLVFQSDRACGTTQLYSMTEQGSDQEPVFRHTNGGTHNGEQLCTADARNPSFAPGGDAIVFDATTGRGADDSVEGARRHEAIQMHPGDRSLFTTEIDSSSTAIGSPVHLTEGPGSDTQPNWGPNAPPVQTPDVPFPALLPLAGSAAGAFAWVARRRHLRAARP